MKWNTKFAYPKSTRSLINGSRHYYLDGSSLPSVTTILSATKSEEDKAAILAWKQRVGSVEAERIKKEASARGSSMHSYIEQFLYGKLNQELLEDNNKSKKMNLGYACINMTLSKQKPKVTTNRSMIKRTFEERGVSYASELALKNVRDLFQILKWNNENGIKLFRLSSEMFPWASEYDLETLPHYLRIKTLLEGCGHYAKQNGIRITSHPGPFNVLTSPNEKVVKNTITDLEIHGKIFDLLGLEKQKITQSLSILESVEGRFEVISENNKIGIVDFAHTPDAIKKVLLSLREYVSEKNKLITIVGCGGGRDKLKRFKMGRISSSLSDISIYTSDNPRDEDPNQIIKDMLEGVEKENRNTFLNLDLTSLTSLLLCAFANSGNKISRLAAKS